MNIKAIISTETVDQGPSPHIVVRIRITDEDAGLETCMDSAPHNVEGWIDNFTSAVGDALKARFA